MRPAGNHPLTVISTTLTEERGRGEGVIAPISPSSVIVHSLASVHSSLTTVDSAGAWVWLSNPKCVCRSTQWVPNACVDLLLITIIIGFKGAVRDFLQSPRCASNCLKNVRSSGQGTIVCKSRATHRAPITCNVLYATWYEGTAQLFSFDRV